MEPIWSVYYEHFNSTLHTKFKCLADYFYIWQLTELIDWFKAWGFLLKTLGILNTQYANNIF